MKSSRLTELEAFRDFVTEKLNNGSADLLPEQALEEWRQRHPEPLDSEDDVAAIQAAIDDFDRGDRGIPLEEFDREFRKKHNIPPIMRFINVQRRARADLDRIYDWLETRSHRGAVSWYRAFWAAAMRIAEDPESYSIVDEAPDVSRPVRQAIFKTRRGKRYRIIFDFSETDVYIYRVRQPGQRPLRDRDLDIR
jgi:plasmid stabilization system protein ParE